MKIIQKSELGGYTSVNLKIIVFCEFWDVYPDRNNLAFSSELGANIFKVGTYPRFL
jgi:hypothetical protein